MDGKWQSGPLGDGLSLPCGWARFAEPISRQNLCSASCLLPSSGQDHPLPQLFSLPCSFMPRGGGGRS